MTDHGSDKEARAGGGPADRAEETRVDANEAADAAAPAGDGGRPVEAEPGMTDAGGVGAEPEAPIDPLAVLRDELAVVREQLAAAEAEKAASRDQLLRALAEGENQRRRHQREKSDTLKYAGAALAKEMLSVADNLERALANIPADALEADPALKALHEGVTATARELAAVLERHQVRKIAPLGEKFDSNFHQAMFELETGEHAPGTVAQVLQPGYVMHGERLLRPALVAVAKAPATKAANDTNGGGTPK
jgi:molecular chaperone GrpE